MTDNKILRVILLLLILIGLGLLVRAVMGRQLES